MLPHLNRYIKLFQTQETLLHELHVQLFELVKQFLVFFIFSLVSAIEIYGGIAELDIKDEKNHLPQKLIFTGSDANKIFQSLRKNDPLVNEIMDILKHGYLKCAEYMIKKKRKSNLV